ncbi:hypothetical protein C8Q76DRAFT_254057 [Earliella scabrosa]|nr:hypothetical protein C8Q76DRAFT_254057 [Earliella scabrosa]
MISSDGNGGSSFVCAFRRLPVTCMYRRRLWELYTTVDIERMAAERETQVGIQLPYELWEQVIRHLPRSDRRACLMISRLVHDVALPIIFSRLTIFFGLWQFADDPVRLAYRQWSQRDAHAMRQTQNSKAVLRHIARAPEFAQVVREMSVAAFSVGHFEDEHACLLEALPCLPNLASFSYYGSRPPLEADILGALRSFCNDSLCELRIPCTTFIGEIAAIQPFRKLQALTIASLSSLPQRTGPAKNRAARILSQMAKSGSPPLTRLSIPDLRWGDPTRMSPHALLELELTQIPASFGSQLAAILNHCTSLRSLTLLDLADTRSGVLASLRQHAAALPQLTSFKFATSTRSDSPDAMPEYVVFASSGKPRLRRLDLFTADDPFVALKALAAHTEVLAIDLGKYFREWTAEDFERLDKTLPIRLSALLICGAQLTNDIPPERWADLVRVYRLRSRGASAVIAPSLPTCPPPPSPPAGTQAPCATLRALLAHALLRVQRALGRDETNASSARGPAGRARARGRRSGDALGPRALGPGAVADVEGVVHAGGRVWERGLGVAAPAP